MPVSAAATLDARLAALAKITAAPGPVVSLYFNVGWDDEHERERSRIFVKNEIRQGRAAAGTADRETDLDWLEEQAEALLGGARPDGVRGVALFACASLGLREALAVRVPLEEVFVVGEAPYLRPLAAVADEAPAALVAFVDGVSARLIPFDAERAGEEVVLESEVPGHHRRGGWALLAQSRYRRHIEDHRGHHLAAVAAALGRLAETHGVERIVLAGETRTVAELRRHLPQRLLGRVVGSVPGARYESGSALIARAGERLGRAGAEADASELDALLTEAAKGGRAAAGLEATLEAVGRRAVHRLYIVEDFGGRGGACLACRTLQPGPGGPCRLCGQPTGDVDLGEAIVSRVIAEGGTVESVRDHPGLRAAGGVAAVLRYPVIGSAAG